MLNFFTQPWWSGISGITGTIAMIVALITVIYSVKAIRGADNQSKEYFQKIDHQTVQLTEALMRPELRAVRSDRALQAIQREISMFNLQGPKPDIWVALMNVGLAVARDIDIRWDAHADEGLPDDGFTMISNDFRFIAAQSDIQVIAFSLYPNDHKIQAGFLKMKIEYSDMVGTRYRYYCKLRYAGSGIPGIAEDSTEVIKR